MFEKHVLVSCLPSSCACTTREAKSPMPGLLFEGLQSVEGLLFEGLLSEGLLFEGLLSVEGLLFEGLLSEGLLFEGLLSVEGLLFEGLLAVNETFLALPILFRFAGGVTFLTLLAVTLFRFAGGVTFFISLGALPAFDFVPSLAAVAFEGLLSVFGLVMLLLDELLYSYVLLLLAFSSAASFDGEKR
jgi:hypothetical protein